MEFKDYYQLMGLKRSATQDEIKGAYRKLARKYHPDVSKEPDADVRFKAIGEAYEVLKDPQKRAAYDQLGENWKAGEQFRPSPGWHPESKFRRGGGFGDANAGQFSDFFQSLFGQGGFSQNFSHRAQRASHSNGKDTHAKVVVDLDDVYQGTTRKLTLKHIEQNVHGKKPGSERILNVKIPRGVCEGQLIRLANQGEVGKGKGKSGDLYLKIEFKPHSLYQVEGKDVYLNLPIAPWEAALGTSIKAPTPAGFVDLKVPPNASNGLKLRLKGRGIPAKEPGDLYVVLQVELPEASTVDSKDAYRSFQAAFSNFFPRKKFGV